MARSLQLVLVTLIAVAGTYLLWFGYKTLDPGEEPYLIEPGTSLRAFSRQLYDKGVLPDAQTLVLWAYLRGHSRGLKAGEYRFEKGITALELLDQVVAGRVISYPLVIVEGRTFKQIVETIAAAPKLRHTLTGLSDDQIMQRLGYPGLHPEGRFFPDTYLYTSGTTDVAILQRAYKKMAATLNREWADREAGLPFQTPEQALVLASIVEKETGLAEERRMIAGVLVNRLRKGIRLQTDPTVIYGMGKTFRGNLRLKDLHTDTPYNTYTRAGLPPTPIAMPGGDAIRATLHPAKTKALYFVSRGDGSHYFSETLREHNNAVIKYQLGGKPKRFSSYPGKPGSDAVPPTQNQRTEAK